MVLVLACRRFSGYSTHTNSVCSLFHWWNVVNSPIEAKNGDILHMMVSNSYFKLNKLIMKNTL